MKREDLVQLERWHADNFGWALHCCYRNWDQAEDVLQDAYLKCVDGRATFSGQSNLKTWFFGVIRLTSMEHSRKAARRKHLSLAATQEVPEPLKQPDANIIDDESMQIFLAHLQKLPSRQSEIMHLVLYQDMTLEEAAPIMDVSIGTVRTHYHRAKERLRELLLESDDG